MLTSKCASRHNGVHFFDISTSKSGPNVTCLVHFDLRPNSVQFFISHLASWLRTRRFSEPTFRPSGATNHWKNRVFRNFPTFSRTWIFLREKVGKPRNTVFFREAFCFSNDLWLRRLAKAAGAEPAGQMRDEKLHAVGAQVRMHKTRHVRTTFMEVEMSKKCTSLWREAHFEVKMYKTHQGRTAFGSCDRCLPPCVPVASFPCPCRLVALWAEGQLARWTVPEVPQEEVAGGGVGLGRSGWVGR